jgi:ATP citrate (pro-S)-lyase
MVGLHESAAQSLLDFDSVCDKPTSFAGFIQGQKEAVGVVRYVPLFTHDGKQQLFPVYGSLDAACAADPTINSVLDYSSSRSSFDSVLKAISKANIYIVSVIAEGIPERHARLIRKAASQRDTETLIIGPSSVGCLVGGSFRCGVAAGSLHNIRQLRLGEADGCVSIITRSGGLLNEMCHLVTSISGGVRQAVSIGGDRYPGSSFLEHALRLQHDPNTLIICLLGEVGGVQELAVGRAIQNGDITKPVVSWVMGTSAGFFEGNVQFGHAGSCANSSSEGAVFKNQFMRACGAYVPETFEAYDDELQVVSKKLGIAAKTIACPPEQVEIKQKSLFFSSISSEDNEQLTYNSVPAADIVTQQHHIGKTLGHLLFKQDLSNTTADFLEVCLTLLADHGIAVSSAHNTAVCTRAGQNMSAAVASGLLCIGNKHGGVIGEAAEVFYNAFFHQILSAHDFVVHRKKLGLLIPGIGHALHNNTDKKDDRIQIIQDWIISYAPDQTPLLDYALAVEAITLRKKSNLILNIDGLIGVVMTELLLADIGTTKTEEILRGGGLQSIFVIARTIGLCSTHIDQLRLKQGMFRQPLNTITYV